MMSDDGELKELILDNKVRLARVETLLMTVIKNQSHVPPIMIGFAGDEKPKKSKTGKSGNKQQNTKKRSKNKSKKT